MANNPVEEVLVKLLATKTENHFELTGTELRVELELIDSSYIEAIDNSWILFEDFARINGWDVYFRGREMGNTPVWDFDRLGPKGSAKCVGQKLNASGKS